MTGFEGAHPSEALQDLLDGRLAAGERREIERHVDGCARCRGELAALRMTREQVAAIQLSSAPPGLTARLRRALDEEDARADSRRRPSLWLAAAAALILLLLVPLWLRRPRSDLPDQVRQAVAAMAADETFVEARGLTPPALEQWFADRGIPFPVRVFDFAAMDIALVGGRVHSLAGKPGALWVYRRGDGTLILCEMYQGSIPPAGSEGEVHLREDGVEFRTLRRGDAVLVFWHEGDVACVLASAGLTAEEARALAYAKAIRV